MPTLWNKEIVSYEVDIFKSSGLTYERSLLLSLAGSDPSTVAIRFGGSVPEDFIVGTGASVWTVHLAEDFYHDMLHLLQTESPLFFSAYENDQGRFAGISTNAEPVGEGPADLGAP